MKLTPRQEALLTQARASTDAYHNARRGAIARARIIARTEIAQYQAVMDRDVRVAFESGIKKLPLRVEGMGTSAAITLEESLARSANMAIDIVAQWEAEVVATAAKAEAIDPFADRYEWIDDDEGDHLLITLTGAELEQACVDQDWTVHAAKEADVDSAGFTLVHAADGTAVLAPVTADGTDFLPKHGRRHPVMVWAQNPANEKQALTWIEAHA